MSESECSESELLLEYLYLDGLIQVTQLSNYTFNIQALTTQVPVGSYCWTISAEDDLSQVVKAYIILTVVNEPPTAAESKIHLQN